MTPPGIQQMGLPGQCNEEDSLQILQRFSEWGGNFIDTANFYGRGISETILGKWLEGQPRDKYVIATKVFFDMGCENNVNNQGLSRRHITDSVVKSLERLRTDYIDLYQQRGIYSICYYVCFRGLFSGKIKRNSRPTEGRLGWVADNEEERQQQALPGYSSFDETIFKTLDVVEAIAKKHSRSVPQVALRWLLQKDVVTSVIIGVRTLQQLDDNMGAANGWALSQEEVSTLRFSSQVNGMQQLDDVSQRPLPYPYEFVFKLNKDRYNSSTSYYVQSQYS
ncbi:uncharacterized protein LOC106013725 [Aplysia californica]|uniref:Uncharacterized protein LOC106013725 n=1 Tax=Aplysia californica TaxID=6500 RepID=A0ABM1W3M5_APLCA|nr:uncharacterized protein LOC106013725 [Aplysia californica]